MRYKGDMDKMSLLLADFLDSVTLEDLAKMYRGKRESLTDSVDYSI